MGADLRHQECLIAFALQRNAEHSFTLAVVIVPCVIEEIDPGIHRLSDDLIGLVLILGRAEVVTAHSEA